MTDYNVILDTEIDSGSAITQALMEKLRDNPTSVSELNIDAYNAGVVNRAIWQSYDGSTSAYAQESTDAGSTSIVWNISDYAEAWELRSVIDLVAATGGGVSSYDIDVYNGTTWEEVLTVNLAGGETDIKVDLSLVPIGSGEYLIDSAIQGITTTTPSIQDVTTPIRRIRIQCNDSMTGTIVCLKRGSYLGRL